MVDYLTDSGRSIAEVRSNREARPRLTVDGYTVRAGSPTPWVVRLEGETTWRRLMVWQFSNAGTLFLRIGGKPLVVRDFEVPSPPPIIPMEAS